MSNKDDAKWFSNRPRAIKTCEACGGHGATLQAFALASADYVVDAPSEAIRAMIVGSSDVFQACREAADIANKSGEPVAFRCQEHTIVVRPGDDPVVVGRQWWLQEHGETPEQTIARR
jgi:hypothetical protein